MPDTATLAGTRFPVEWKWPVALTVGAGEIGGGWRNPTPGLDV